MSDNLNQNPGLPPEQTGKLKFILVALGTIPAGLLIVGGLGHSYTPDGLKEVASLIILLTFVGSVAGSIGLHGGWGTEVRPKILFLAFLQGVILFFVELIIIFFAGCAILIAHS